MGKLRKIAFTHYPDYFDGGLETYIIETDATNTEIEACMAKYDYPDASQFVIDLVKREGYSAKIICKVDAFYDYVNGEMG